MGCIIYMGCGCVSVLLNKCGVVGMCDCVNDEMDDFHGGGLIVWWLLRCVV